jgi:hypothetical protein
VSRLQQLLFGSIAIVCALTLPLMVAEIALRITGRPHPVVIGWNGGPGQNNDFGFRGQRLNAGADLRLVLLGDSQVASARTAFDDMPEAHLRQALGKAIGGTVSVVSIGTGGWGQDQELLALSAHIRTIRPPLSSFGLRLRMISGTTPFLPTSRGTDGRSRRSGSIAAS